MSSRRWPTPSEAAAILASLGWPAAPATGRWSPVSRAYVTSLAGLARPGRAGRDRRDAVARPGRAACGSPARWSRSACAGSAGATPATALSDDSLFVETGWWRRRRVDRPDPQHPERRPRPEFLVAGRSASAHCGSALPAAADFRPTMSRRCAAREAETSAVAADRLSEYGRVQTRNDCASKPIGVNSSAFAAEQLGAAGRERHRRSRPDLCGGVSVQQSACQFPKSIARAPVRRRPRSTRCRHLTAGPASACGCRWSTPASRSNAAISSNPGSRRWSRRRPTASRPRSGSSAAKAWSMSRR